MACNFSSLFITNKSGQMAIMTTFQQSGYFVIQKPRGRKLAEVLSISDDLPRETEAIGQCLLVCNPRKDGKLK